MLWYSVDVVETVQYTIYHMLRALNVYKSFWNKLVPWWEQAELSQRPRDVKKPSSYSTVKPVCNDHLYNKIYFLWFIQLCVLMKTEGTDLLLITISAFCSSSRWPLAT